MLAGGPPGAPELDPALGLTLGLILVVLNGFFVAAEFALVKVRPTQIEPHAAAGRRRGIVARRMIRHLDAYLSATQLGITLTSLGLGWVGEPAFAWMVEPLIGWVPGLTPERLHTVSLFVAFFLITVLHIVLGELAPKSLAIRKSEATTLWTALPLYFFYKLTYPMIWLLNRAANAILELVGIEPATESHSAHGEEELRLLLASSTATHMHPAKRELLANVFDFSRRIARQVMVPRSDVIYLSTEKSLEENLEIARKSGHTRLPLCEGDLDHIIGMIHIKDLFQAEVPITSLRDVARSVPMIPETLPLDRVLRRMRREKMHLAAILDEYGGVSGIVTFENVIEEIVGQVEDEFDTEKPELEKKGENLYRVSGAMLVEDLESALDLQFSDRDEDTVGGVVLSEIGRRPAEGDRVELPPLTLEVLEVTGNRIQTLQVTVQPPPAREAGEGGGE